jgi:hypothetical protein
MPYHRHADLARVIGDEKDHLEADRMNEEECEFRRDVYFPCFLPAAGLALMPVRRGDLDVRRQALDLYTATHTADLRRGGRITSYVYSAANVLAIRVAGMKDCALRLALSPEALDSADPASASPVSRMMRREVFRKVQHRWGPAWAEQEVDYADGNRALLRLELRGGLLRPPRGDRAEASLAITNDSFELMLAVTSAREGAFLGRRLGKLIENAWQRDFDRLHSDHANYWHERWSRSAILIPERVLEAEWYFALYTMAASSRGQYPAPLMSAWNLRLDQPFHGDYHNNINSQQSYWPVFAANHADLAEVFIRHFWSVLPEMEAETRRVWNAPGARVPFASAGGGKDFWGVGYWRYELFVSGFTAQIAWWHYAFTRDRDFLARYGWPLIKAVSDFYIACLNRDPRTARWFLPWSKTCEDTVFNVVPRDRLVRDTITDLAAVHAHLRDAAAAAEALGQEAEARRYREVLAELTPLAVEDGEFAIYPGAPLDLPVSHPYTLEPIYPCGLATALGPAALRPVAEKTLRTIWRCSSRVTRSTRGPARLHWNDDLSMGWIGAARAWMGDGDGALDAVLHGWIAHCLLPNGFQSAQMAPPADRPAKLWMQNQLSGTANVVTEMLLQSHSGVIQVFPAIPRAWRETTFVRLLARGGVQVSASRRRGRTEWVALTATAPATVRLRNPWPALAADRISAVEAGSPNTRKALRLSRAGELVLALRQGESVTLCPRGTRLPEGAVMKPRDASPGPVRFPARGARGPQPLWTSWLGKPARRGR